MTEADEDAFNDDLELDQDAEEEGEGEGDVLEFTPEEDAEIEGIAESVFDLMDQYEMDCEVHFPDFTMEVPYGTPVDEIVAAYEDFCRQIAEAKTDMAEDKDT